MVLLELFLYCMAFLLFLVTYQTNTAAVCIPTKTIFNNVKIYVVITSLLIFARKKNRSFKSFTDQQYLAIVASTCLIKFSNDFEGLEIYPTSFAPIFLKNISNTAAVSF